MLKIIAIQRFEELEHKKKKEKKNTNFNKYFFSII